MSLFLGYFRYDNKPQLPQYVIKSKIEMTTLGKTPPLITQIDVLVLHMTKLKIASMLVNHSTGLHFHRLTSMLFKNASHYNINQVAKKKERKFADRKL